MIVSEIIKEVLKLANGSLNFQDDLERVISLAIESNRMDELEELAFNAKFLIGLFRIIQKKNAEVDENYVTNLQKEFHSAIEKVTSSLKKLLENENQFLNEIFRDKYFQLSQAGLNNMIKLSSDLSFLKLYLNDLKIKKGSSN